jgi:thioredoxin reductase
VSVLFDLLQHPDADSGQERAPLLEWRRRPDLAVEHVAVGRGPAGGCWQSLEGSVQTVSLGSWMELPGLRLAQTLSSNEAGGNRVKVSDVASYYQEYIRRMNLGAHFRNHAVITSVREVSDIACSLFDSQSTPTATPVHKRIVGLENDEGAEDNAMFKTECLLDQEADEEVARASAPSCRCQISTCGSDMASDDATMSSCTSPSTSCSCSCSTVSSSPSSKTCLPVADASRAGDANRGDAFPPRPNILIRREYDESSARDGQLELEELATSCLSWDPIVNPELFCSLGAGGSSVGGAGSYRRPSWFSRSRRTSACSLLGTSYRKPSRCHVSECFPDRERIFEVRGREADGQEFVYLAENIVLATGSYDRPNRVGLPNEGLSHVLHSVNDLETFIHDGEGSGRDQEDDPVLVLGAGLSAADAVIMLRAAGRRVVHAFRKSADDDSLVFRMLPPALYPEYHRVYGLMRSRGDADYRPLPCHRLVEISSDGHDVVLARVEDDELVHLRVSRLVVLIGASPDLSFLDPSILTRLGVRAGEPIGRSNPVDVDPFTCEVASVANIYAMGPLVGDNFVRFLQGGALAIANDLLKKSTGNNKDDKR